MHFVKVKKKVNFLKLINTTRVTMWFRSVATVPKCKMIRFNLLIAKTFQDYHLQKTSEFSKLSLCMFIINISGKNFEFSKNSYNITTRVSFCIVLLLLLLQFNRGQPARHRILTVHYLHTYVNLTQNNNNPN